MMCSRFAVALALATSLAPAAHALEILRWERLPLAVPLVVGQERVVFIDRNVRVGVPPSIGNRLRVQSAAGAIYLRASEPIEPTRIRVQDADTGALILIDIAAEEASPDQQPLEPVRIVEGETAPVRYGDFGAASDTGATKGDGPLTGPARETPVPVVLTRHAAQSLFAPLRTIEPVADIARVNLNRNMRLDMLMPTVPVRANALAAWRLDDLWVTAVRLKLSPGAGVSLAPFADPWRLVDTPSKVQTLDADALDEDQERKEEVDGDEQRDVLGELEITARLMITGGEDKEEARMTRADRSLIRQSVIDAAHRCAAEKRTVLTRDVRDALRERGHDTTVPDGRRARLLEMADAMDMFCQGVDGEMFDRPGTPWPEADITVVDLATFAREGYNAQLSIAYISLINTVNNIAERDQYLGRPIINVTDEGHIITKNPLLAPYVVKITKMWRKLGAWYWLATQNLDDLPRAAEPMLNMIEWWICLSMPPDEVEKIAHFREMTPSQKALMLSARKEMGKYTEGVILSRSMELLFRAVPPSLYLALAMTEADEKAERFELMQEFGIGELEAAFKVAEKIDRARGIESLPLDDLA